MAEFVTRRYVYGEKLKVDSLGIDEVIAEFADGSRMYIVIMPKGIRVRCVQSAMSTTLSIRPEAVNTVRIELGEDE